MDDDIVTTIRHTAWLAPEGETWADQLREAADEIERLRRQVDDLTRCLHDDQFEIARLRAERH